MALDLSRIGEVRETWSQPFKPVSSCHLRCQQVLDSIRPATAFLFFRLPKKLRLYHDESESYDDSNDSFIVDDENDVDAQKSSSESGESSGSSESDEEPDLDAKRRLKAASSGCIFKLPYNVLNQNFVT